MKQERDSHLFGAKWVAGLAATAATSNAAVVYMDLGTNVLSNDGSSNFNADLVAGGAVELDFSSGATLASVKLSDSGGPVYYARARLIGLSGYVTVGTGSGMDNINTNTSTVNSPISATGNFAITFSDATVNGGSLTNALVEVTGTSGLTTGSQRLAFTRLYFDDGNASLASSALRTGIAGATEFVTVPEPSGLALLAMGAGGLALRRQRKIKV